MITVFFGIMCVGLAVLVMVGVYGLYRWFRSAWAEGELAMALLLVGVVLTMLGGLGWATLTGKP